MSFPFPKTACETSSKVNDSKLVFLINGESFMKGSLIRFRASRTILPGISMLDALKKFPSILIFGSSSVLPISNLTLCFLNKFLRKTKSKSITFHPVMMSGSSFRNSCLNFSKQSSSFSQETAFFNFSFVTIKFFL